MHNKPMKKKSMYILQNQEMIKRRYGSSVGHKDIRKTAMLHFNMSYFNEFFLHLRFFKLKGLLKEYYCELKAPFL